MVLVSFGDLRLGLAFRSHMELCQSVADLSAVSHRSSSKLDVCQLNC